MEANSSTYFIRVVSGVKWGYPCKVDYTVLAYIKALVFTAVVIGSSIIIVSIIANMITWRGRKDQVLMYLRRFY